jgi:hypothetical protein
MSNEKLFSVIEYSSFFAVRHNPTSKEHPMGDGVDTLFDENDEALSPGSEGFVEKWENVLNADAEETLEAYFPEESETEVAKNRGLMRAQLDDMLAEAGMKVDDVRRPHASDSNLFCDLYIGTGKPVNELVLIRDRLNALGLDASIGRGNNPGHPAYGKQFVELKSFWDDPLELFDCGSCGCYHPVDYDGDCRADEYRFASVEEAKLRTKRNVVLT